MAFHPLAALNNDPLATAKIWLEVHHRVVLAAVVSTSGSSPDPVGGQLVIGPNDEVQGSVAGGCVEAGLSETEMTRIRAPVGLPIGAKGPAEIAVSILAEIIAAMRRAA